MSTAGQFDDDAFISYGSIDNERIEEKDKGWVDNFHDRLEKRLAERLGYRPKVWRDKRMPGNVYFVDHLGEKIAGSRVLVTVLSPGYIQSAWCMGELNAFYQLAESRNGLTTKSGRVRVFKVIKTFIEREEHPQQLQGMRPYEFYEVDKESLRPIEFGQGLDRHYDQRYWNRLDELVWDITQTLGELKPPRAAVLPAYLNTPTQPPDAKKGSVYLAVTTSDLREQRDRIRFELLDHGFEVLPEGELPNSSPDFEEAVRESLRRAKLSIHLIGERYGLIPEGAGDSSVVRLQNEIAAERSGEAGFARVIWLPVSLQPREQKQAQFIDYLKTSTQPQRGAELLQSTLEELKSVIRTRLTSTNGHRPAKAAAAPRGPRRVYLICDRRDAQGMLPLYRSLTRRGYKVLLPLLEEGAGSADDAQADKLHWDNLKRCDAVLVYYGGARQDWFDYKMQDLERVPTLERAGSLLARGVYVTSPSTLHKEIYEPNENEGVLVKHFGEFSEELLEPFVAEIEAAAKGVEDAGQE
ncbi:MAG: TIR domain-containing protein [Pyrinomonadaceae bacterium]